MSETKQRRVAWTKRMAEEFFETLASTCNVSEAARAIGVPRTNLYHKRVDPAFAERWDAALKLGYQMLETRLVGHALAGKGLGDPIDRDDLPPIDPVLARLVLGMQRRALAGPPRKPGRRAVPTSPEQTNAALLKQIEAAERRVAKAAQ